MISINVSGWKKGLGSYDVDVPFDDGRMDVEVRFRDGGVFRQEGPFAEESHDWNNDGDVYPLFGAWFRDDDGRGEFLAPETMMRLVMDGEAEVSGLDNPLAALERRIDSHSE